MGADDKPVAGTGADHKPVVGSKPGTTYGYENYQPECRNLDPKVEQSKAYKESKKQFGPSAHEVQWGPDVFQSYTDLNNPFYYRTPKGMLDTPAHVPQNPICLELHLANERQRLTGMSKAEREWRQKYLDDQELHPDEPFFIEDAQMQLNPWRKLYRWPWDTFARKFMYPIMGLKNGHYYRQRIPKYMLGFVAFEFIYYYVKYNQQTWDDVNRCSTMTPNPQLCKRDEMEDKYPGLIEKAYPVFKKAEDFYDLGYRNRTVLLDVGETRRPW